LSKLDSNSKRPTDIERTALHEAGHAVAAIQLGVDGQDYGFVTVIPQGNINGSFSISEISDSISDIHRDIIINCAGYGALRALGYSESFASIGCGDDFAKSKILIKKYSLLPLNHWKDQAISLLSLPKNTRAVKAVADNLLQHKTLGPIYTQITVKAATGLLSSIEFQQYKDNCQAAGLSYWLD
jgi:hypothetical protein